MQVRAIHPKELGAPERARWDALRAASHECRSPYFSFPYIQAIGAVRRDARVVIIEDDGAITGFLPVQRSSRFAAMGLGAPISDVQGLIATAPYTLDPASLCRALQVGRIDILSTPAGHAALSAHLHGRSETFVTRLHGLSDGGFERQLRTENPGTVKKQNQKRRKLERDHGPLRFTAFNRNRADLESLLDWKRRQCRATRQPPVWETPWVAAALDRIWALDDPDFRLVFCTLHAGETLAGGLVLLQSGPLLHAWIIGYEPALAVYSPGVLVGRAAMGWAADSGFAEVDWGGGRYDFKEMLTHEVRPMAWGSLHGRSVSGLVRDGLYRVRAAMEQTPMTFLRDLPGKAMRRLDVHRGLGLFSSPSAP